MALSMSGNQKRKITSYHEVGVKILRVYFSLPIYSCNTHIAKISTYLTNTLHNPDAQPLATQIYPTWHGLITIS